MKIDVYNRKILMFQIELDNNGKVCEVIIKSKDIFNPFYYLKNENKQEIWDKFLKSRIFDEKRGDKKELLKSLELNIYEPLLIAKKTHGIILSDCVWMKFDNESFSWEDVCNVIYT